MTSFKVQKYLTILYFLFLFFSISPAFGQTAPPPMMLNDERGIEIGINNRILAIVDGKPITVLDVMKKMNLFFFQEYPEYASSKVARYQFYSSTWKTMLKQVVNEELILAEMETQKMPVTAGDVRQELETRFGPNIISNLDKIGLSVEEAKKMLREEIIIRRVMMSFSGKGIKEAGPQAVKNAYQEYAQENEQPATWVYRVISIKDQDPEKSAKIAKLASTLLEQNIPLDDLVEAMKKTDPVCDFTAVSISPEYRHNENEISPAYKEALAKLTPPSFSASLEHIGRKDKKVCYRIFYAKEFIPRGAPPFDEVAISLKERIIQKVIERETSDYLDKIRRKHAVEDQEILKSIPDDFAPFALQQNK